MSEDQQYDVVVIGGGAAGLSGALTLGRSRRRVLVLDGDEPRNAPADQAHNYLGREGIAPRDLLAIGRAEVSEVGVEVAEDPAVTVTESGDGSGFLVTTATGRRVAAPRVLVASGAGDVLPEVPGLAQRWGRDVLHCPYCHGWEMRDRAIAILASTPMAAHHALLFAQLSDDVVVVILDGVELPAEEIERLTAIGVSLERGTPREVLLTEDRLVGLRRADGSVLACDAVVVASRPYARADALAALGLVPEPVMMGEIELGSRLAVHEMTGATAVPGVYAAGNVTDPMMTLIASAAHGVRVGAVINADLANEAAAEAVRARRADLFESESWEERYSGEAVWTGRPNAALVAETTSLRPGRALDVGCGEGGDVVWLAQQGWQVTGMDFAAAALRRTAEHAKAAGVGDQVTTRQGDVRTFEPGGEEWDLVSAHFVHLPEEGMVEVTRRLASAVATVGTLLVVGHHPAMAQTLAAGHAAYLFTPESLVPALDPELWLVEVCQARERLQDHPHTGEPMTAIDAVLRARRR